MRWTRRDSPAANSPAAHTPPSHSDTKHQTQHTTQSRRVWDRVAYNFPFVYQLHSVLWPFIASFSKFWCWVLGVCLPSGAPCIACPQTTDYGLPAMDYGLRPNDATCQHQQLEEEQQQQEPKRERQTNASDKGAAKVWLPAYGIHSGVSWHCQKPQRTANNIQRNYLKL